MSRPVVGIDPSLAATGLAILRENVQACETIVTKGTKADTWTDRDDRLDRIAERVVAAVPARALVLIESPAYSRTLATSASQHDRSGLWWRLFHNVRTYCHGVDIVTVTPTQRSKYATGKGNAGKDTVLAAVVRRYPAFDVRNNNEADALVLAAMGARMIGQPIEASLPAVQIAVVGGLVVPEGMTL